MNGKIWTTYCITPLNKPEGVVVLVLSFPIEIPKKYYSFASSLAKLGIREFHWVQSGPFLLKSEALICQRKFVVQLIRTTERTLYNTPKLGRPMKYPDPYTPRTVAIDTQERIISAAQKLVLSERRARNEYLESYAPPEKAYIPRKTPQDKKETRRRRNERFRNTLTKGLM